MTIVGHSNNLPLAFTLITSCAALNRGEISTEDMRTCSGRRCTDNLSTGAPLWPTMEQRSVDSLKGEMHIPRVQWEI